MKPYTISLIFCVLLGSATLIMVVFSVLPVQAMPHEDHSTASGGFKNDQDNFSPNIMIVPPSLSPTARITYTQHLPIIFGFGLLTFELKNYWVADSEGLPILAFRSGELIQNVVEGINNNFIPIQAKLEISRTNGSDIIRIISETLTLPNGTWELSFSSTAPTNTGVYTQRAELSNKTISQSLEAYYMVNQMHGFDRCYAPTLEQMQTWWERSPYYVFNLYIGGVSFACRDEPVNALWIQKAAEQGWDFILTWVGPQAPCTSFKYRMSSNPAVAYVEGKLEAEYASEAAHKLGFASNALINYDIEGYPDAESCRDAVKSFLNGWVEQLELIGLRAGAYGSPCRSYITDWATINNPPQDVWIAHWIADEFDPTATVWNVPCGLENSYWSYHQRLKQYAGGHKESWGGVELVIDSNVLDGHITSLPLPTSNTTTKPVGLTTMIQRSGPQIDDFGLIGDGHGWVLTDGHLLVTTDGGSSWEQYSPANIQVSAAGYAPTGEAWLVGRDTELKRLHVGHATAGGDWELYTFPEAGNDLEYAIARTFVEPIDRSTAFLVYKLISSSNFSIGRIFLTPDGGRTWQERSIPIGEEVHFRDLNNGWTAGGATGNEYYQTEDGGITWQSLPTDDNAQDMGSDIEIHNNLATSAAKTSVSNPFQAWTYVIDNKCQGDKGEKQLLCTYTSALLATNDGGTSWSNLYPR